MQRIESLKGILNCEFVENGTVIVFGAGKVGRKIFSYLKYKKKKVFITDNNEKSYADLERGIPVLEIKKIFSDTNVGILICVAKFSIANEICDQSANAGIPQNKIYWCEGYFTNKYKEELLERGLFNGRKVVKCLRGVEAEKKIAEKIEAGMPFLCSRWGSVEGEALFSDTIGGLFNEYTMQNNAGIFPVDNSNIIKEYFEISRNAARIIDYYFVATWCWEVEELYELFSTNAIPVRFRLEPHSNSKWLKSLQGKKVLVVHPYASLIEEQYKIKDRLFVGDVIPDFELVTVKAVQSMGGQCEFTTWVEAYEYMKNEIASKDFDVALLGCGAYGMPLGAFIKDKLKKPAIHVGGVLQLLFGIKGKRWDENGVGQQLYNQYWVRPTEDLKPDNYKLVEDGCYW